MKMKYNSREEFQIICESGLKHTENQGRKFTWCHDSFWLRMYPGDRAISDNIINAGHWEAWDAMAISNVIDDKKDWTFIDVGANIGYYSMLAATAGSKVHAFECNPNLTPYIRDSAYVNQLDIEVHGVALGDKDDTATLSVNFENIGGASLMDLPSTNETHEVQVRTLDGELKDLGANFIIKVDVEGFERNVWWGAKDLRSKYDNIWFMEWFNTRWTRKLQEEFLNEVTQTHSLNVTTTKGSIEPATIESVLDTSFTTLVLKKNA